MGHLVTSLQDRDIEYEPAEHPPENDQLQKLKELFEQNAGLISAGCRDTIDSILSKYGAVRDEVEQDPRIGLVLSAEFAITPTQRSFPALPIDQADRTPNERPTDIAEDPNLCDSGGLLLKGARDPMVDYADYLSQIVNSTSNDSSSSIEEESATPNNDSDGYLTQDTGTTWDDHDHTRLDIYADLDTNLFQNVAGTDCHVDEDSVANSAEDTNLVPEERKGRLSRSNALTMSPVMQVAAFDSKAVASTGRVVADDSAIPSDAGKAGIATKSVRTNQPEAASASGRVVDLHDTTALSDSHDPPQGRLHDGSLLPEDSASNIVVVTEHLKDSHTRNAKVVERPALEYDADNLLKHVPERLQDNVEEWLEQVGNGQELSMAETDHKKEAVALSFFASLEQEVAAEHVLNAGMAVAFAAVALVSHVFGCAPF